MYYNTIGNYNSASGSYALYYNTTGANNTATGYNVLKNNTSGDNNNASGSHALYFNSTGNFNTASGNYALHNTTTGSLNTAFGGWSLGNNTTGSNNTALGTYAQGSSDNATNQTVIGYGATGQSDNSVTLGNSEVTAVYMGQNSSATVYAAGLRTASNTILTLSGDDATFADDITVNGDIVISSDARLKANIVSLGATLAKLLQIDGKTYTMKKNGKQKIGVLAQNIQKVFPELVSKDDNEMLAVNYQGLVPVLINAIKEQNDKISRLEHLVKKLIEDK
jgi:hypothetical protein